MYQYSCLRLINVSLFGDIRFIQILIRLLVAKPVPCYMSLSQLLQKMHSSKLEYLLPLPLLLVAFGLGGESLTNLLLSRSYTTPDKLQADTHTAKVKFATNVLVTEVEIEKEQEFTEVELQTANSVLKKLIFKVPATELNSLKAIIAQEMGVSGEVKTLQTDTQIQMKSEVQVLGILAEIEKKRGFTKVEVNTANSILKKLEFEFPVTELNSVKAIITQELGLSREDARMFVSYRIKN
ncbi:hypothetical protein [Fischerella thermalis]|uniref:hypothetical protein n=1 Tax=Fischerella thermalis TaxID=372787 RepID=UPI0019F4B985|nr:hypothetical protein [Fischerella thermalis]MBF1988734.1 hypothetical protein [Fischerella thermalis M58_A2018_009]MBF2061188.1 hypothetical protein [Fischerella thermalis M66_A2018_004]MBF2069189.1 hypothetical protein [Fischerella thermalis M48_A2018_028]